jgi:hypothetical protein
VASGRGVRAADHRTPGPVPLRPGRMSASSSLASLARGTS